MNFATTTQMIADDIQAGFPGISLGIIQHGRVLLRQFSGYACKYADDGSLLPDFQSVSAETIFDLASNSKIYATTLAYLHLVSDGQLSLDNRVSKFFPHYRHATVTLRQLLSHSAGYAPEVLFFDQSYAAEFYALDRKRVGQLLIEEVPLAYQPGTQAVYSDSGFMLLGFILEEISGIRLDKLLQQHIYQPLGLKHTGFNPLQRGIEARQIAATSLGNGCNGTMNYPQMRTDLIRGEVQDEKAFYCYEGIAGHAGLFSTLDDMLKLTQLILNRGWLDDVQLFSVEVLSEFVKPSSVNPAFCCGWRNSSSLDLQKTFGRYMNASCRGHSGFTGTLSLVDFDNQLGIIILTNKVHSQCINRMSYAGSNYNLGKYAPLIEAIYQDLSLNKF